MTQCVLLSVVPEAVATSKVQQLLAAGSQTAHGMTYYHPEKHLAVCWKKTKQKTGLWLFYIVTCLACVKHVVRSHLDKMMNAVVSHFLKGKDLELSKRKLATVFKKKKKFKFIFNRKLKKKAGKDRLV